MLASTLLYGLLAAVSMVDAASPKKQIKYEVVTGIFQQDDAATDPNTFDFLASNFGLINRTYPSDPKTPDSKYSTQWQRLNKYVKYLNKEKKTRYSLLFLGRHGEGFHNAAETYFGTPAWNCFWSERDGNGTVTWADAKLTENGVEQARKVNSFWARLLSEEGIAAPDSYYTSPLYRCLDTARLTFANLTLPKKKPFVPTVKEFLREGISAHTCDRRSSKSYIHQQFPSFIFEKGFSEADPYWEELMAEPSAAQDVRSKAVLDDIFTHDDATYISITSHSGEIGSLLRGTSTSPSLLLSNSSRLTHVVHTVLGHRSFKLATGAAIPVLVKQTTLDGAAPPSSTVPWDAQRTCAAPPTIRDSSCNDCSCCL
jgi:broad specificity phosphatase PhoE